MKKYILLILLMFFLTGCGWSDIQKQYGDLLKTKPVCTYYKEGDIADDLGINILELSADYNGIYGKINKGTKQTLFGSESGNGHITTPDGIDIQFTKDFFEAYFKIYQENENKCPERVYIPLDSYHQIRAYDCTDMGYVCKTYTLQLPTIEVPEKVDKCYCIPNTDYCKLFKEPTAQYTQTGDMSKCNKSNDNDNNNDNNNQDNNEDDKPSDSVKIDCHYSLATYCSKVIKKDDKYGNTVYLEFGYYEKSGQIKKYFGAGDDANYNNFIYDDNDQDGFLVHHNVEFYEIPDEGISEIWLSNNEIIDKEKLVITASVSNSGTKYIITGSKETNYGPSDDTGDVEDAPNIDPDKIEVPEINLKPEKVDNCQSLFGDPTVKDPATPAYYMSVAFSVMRYAAIILLLVLTIMDFVSAVASQDNDILKKTVNKTMKRAMLCVIIFFLPTLISFVLQIIHTSQINDCINLDV